MLLTFEQVRRRHQLVSTVATGRKLRGKNPRTMQTDEALMLAYRQGDRVAFDTLVRRHWGACQDFVRRIVRDQALVDDVLVECFYKLHKAAASYEPQARFTTFLYRIAYHEAVNQLRTQQRKSHLPTVDFAPGLESSLASTQPTVEQAMVAREELEELEELLSSLNELQRAVFLLFYREELPTPEIAEALSIPVTSVRAYLSLARKALRERMTVRERASIRPGLTGR